MNRWNSVGGRMSDSYTRDNVFLLCTLEERFLGGGGAMDDRVCIHPSRSLTIGLGGVTPASMILDAGWVLG